MAITASLVKELRDKSGAGMMDAKKALTETGGDMEAAADWLRTKGLAKADKKAGRTAAEGLVAVSTGNGTGVVVEVNSETDFVAKNVEFQSMVGAIAGAATDVEDVEALKSAEIGGKSVGEALTDAIAKIGENMTIRRMAKITGEDVTSYVHNAAAAGMGKIGVLVAYTGSNAGVAKQVAMHIAAVNPTALGEADMDPALVEKEKKIQMDIARESGKPEQVIEKMEIAELLKVSDIISIHVPLIPETQSMINEKTLGSMKPSAILINAARGGIVNETDLYHALKNGVIAGAGIDVFENEPPSESPLLELDNVVLTPHTAAFTFEGMHNMSVGVVEQLIEYCNGNKPAYAVNPEVWDAQGA